PLHALRDAQRLERVVEGRLARLHVAEPAAASAGVAEDHERGGAGVPALADVRAGGLLADRVERVALDLLLQLEIARRPRHLHLEPRRLALAERPDLAYLEDAGAVRIRSRSRAHAGIDSTAVSEPSRRAGETIRVRSANA